MEALLMVLIEALLSGVLEYIDSILLNLVPMAFYAERFLDQMLGRDAISELFNILFSFGVSLIILKFIKKGFNTYILWIDGDADTDPILYLTYFVKALVVAISFPTLYGWMATIVQGLTDKLLNIISRGVIADFSIIIASVVSGGLVPGIIGVIFFGCLLYLYIKFLQTGLEILVLRLGIPMACVGLVDSDQGVFKTYMQKFFQSMITVMLQIVLLKLSLALVINGHLIWATATIFMALRTPKFLQEFIILPGGQGGMMGKAYQATRLVQMVRGAVK
ncbi:conjugal transfer protein TrbL family protein [Desulfosporosinus nitroreducens]|uniref:DUF6102 family protein n=1 Tax=Desulfosporosinus nitroreducens TaxID=2018668 RepID=A0ABT8QSE8_9FIRM|nr:conjugal transfer protein TrbL family protein [Desulfosporosinus nitroreducens]MDO0824065.1 DUF6102 family protein [Desulfosporosinus nitroreducens]